MGNFLPGVSPLLLVVVVEPTGSQHVLKLVVSIVTGSVVVVVVVVDATPTREPPPLASRDELARLASSLGGMGVKRGFSLSWRSKLSMVCAGGTLDAYQRSKTTHQINFLDII